MNKNVLMAGALGLLAVALPALSQAAGVTLTNGGLGQSAGNASQFGVAVCNGGKTSVTASVPVSVSANSVNATVDSASSIAAGACAYTYLPYNQFGMKAGSTYTVSVTIDPNHTMATNANNQTSYSVTVPGGNGAQTSATADVSAQSGNIFSSIWNFLFGWIK